jgi:phosphate transport system substrate-binding protein
MRTRLGSLRWALVPALALGLVATSATGAGAAKLATATLTGAGSSLQGTFEQSAIAAFTKANSSVTINYNVTSSGGGRQNLIDGVVDYAGSDAPFAAADAAKLKGPILYFPIILSPITVAYTLSGVSKLQLDGPTISKIFQATVKTWNDPAIVALNPGVTLPSTAITVVHRSDSSGTTQNFATFLTKADPAGWKLGAGSTAAWPASTQGASGSAGVANAIGATNGAVGYVDYSDAKAKGLAFASIKNQLGKFIVPSIKGASEAAATVAVNADLTFDPTYATGDTSYPITAVTYVIVYKTQTNAAKSAALKAFVTYLETKGQKLASKVDYAPLAPALAKQAATQVKQIVG